jgi:hypothetical protein
MHAKRHAKVSGPGPMRDLMYKKKQLPMKRNTAIMTVGAASMYWPAMIFVRDAVGSLLERAMSANLMPRQDQLRKIIFSVVEAL